MHAFITQNAAARAEHFTHLIHEYNNNHNNTILPYIAFVHKYPKHVFAHISVHHLYMEYNYHNRLGISLILYFDVSVSCFFFLKNNNLVNY